MRYEFGGQVSQSLLALSCRSPQGDCAHAGVQWEPSARDARHSAAPFDSNFLQSQPRYSGLASSVTSPRAELPDDVRASLDSRLSNSHRERVHQLAERLRTNIDLESDEILAALKHSPLTASHAEARTSELLSDVMAADHQISLRRPSEQISQKDAEPHSLEQQIDTTRQQLYAAQAAQQSSRDRAGHAASESSQLQVQVDSLKAEVERHRRDAAEAHAARLESDKALAAAQSSRSTSQLALQAKLDELEQSRLALLLLWCVSHVTANKAILMAILMCSACSLLVHLFTNSSHTFW